MAMSYIHHHIVVAEKLIKDYTYNTPFSVYLKDYFSKNKKHGSKDRKSITHLCYTCFRIGKCLLKEDFQTRLKVAIYLCNNSMPPYAETLYHADELVWHDTIEQRIKEVKLNHADFSINDIFPLDSGYLSERIDADKFIIQHFIQPKLFARIRPGYKDKVINKLNAENISYELIENNCIALDNKTALDNILKLNEEVVIQDYSSQQIAAVFRYINAADKILKVWDCCAASGGKSILLHDHIPDIYLTVSDIRGSIIANLKERFRRAGITNYDSFVADISKADNIVNQSAYDLIIADVPCTGSGTWGRTPEYLSNFTKESIIPFAERQKQMMDNITSKVKKKGYLIYITCSAFKAENEDITEHILKHNPSYTLLHQQVMEGYNYQADTMYAAVLQNT